MSSVPPFPIYPVADSNDDGFEGVELCWMCGGEGTLLMRTLERPDKTYPMNCPECNECQ